MSDAPVAQRSVQLPCNETVAGSIPAGGSITVESISVKTWRGSLGAFVCALRDMEVGQSFVHHVASPQRTAISVLQALYPDRRYATRKIDGKTFRVGRIA